MTLHGFWKLILLFFGKYEISYSCTCWFYSLVQGPIVQIRTQIAMVEIVDVIYFDISGFPVQNHLSLLPAYIRAIIAHPREHKSPCLLHPPETESDCLEWYSLNVISLLLDM